MAASGVNVTISFHADPYMKHLFQPIPDLIEAVFPLTTAVKEFEVAIHTALLEFVDETPNPLQDLKNKGYRLSITIEAKIPLFGRQSFQLGQKYLAVDTLKDLLALEQAQAASLGFAVYFHYYAAQRDLQFVEKERNTKPGFYDDENWRLFRLGNVHKEYFPADNVQGRIAGSDLDRDIKIHTEDKVAVWSPTLLGVYPSGNTKDKDSLMFVIVWAWEFGDYSIIGNPGDGPFGNGSLPCTFLLDAKYYAPYEEVIQHAGIHRRIQEYIKVGEPELASGVPFLPTYTRNVFEPQRHGLGVLRSHVAGCGRYVNHLRHDPDETIRNAACNIAFLPNISYWLDHDCDTADVQALLLGDLKPSEAMNTFSPNRRSKHKGKEREKVGQSSGFALFQPPLEDMWTLGIWILPHGFKKMFKMVERHHCVCHFLSPGKVMDNDGRLYVEAHIVGKKP